MAKRECRSVGRSRTRQDNRTPSPGPIWTRRGWSRNKRRIRNTRCCHRIPACIIPISVITCKGLRESGDGSSRRGQIWCSDMMASLQNRRPITSSSSRPYLQRKGEEMEAMRYRYIFKLEPLKSFNISLNSLADYRVSVEWIYFLYKSRQLLSFPGWMKIAISILKLMLIRPADGRMDGWADGAGPEWWMDKNDEMADLPKCERQLGVYAISLDGLRVHVDDAPQHGRIVSGEGYLPSGQIQGQHAIGRCFLIDALSAELIP